MSRRFPRAPFSSAVAHRLLVRPMRARLLIASLLTTVVASSPARASEDHLVPREERSEVRNYYGVLAHKLFVTPADYGRFLVLRSPASVGEDSVALWSSGARAQLSYTKASRNIYSSLMSPNDPTYRGPVTTARIDAPISASAAAAVRRAWGAMLQHISPRREPLRQIIIHGEVYEFSIGSRRAVVGAAIEGQTGTNASEMINIGRLLIDYSRAALPRRERLAREIERRATHLASRVETMRPTRPNQAMERTSDRFTLHFEMTSTLALRATRVDSFASRLSRRNPARLFRLPGGSPARRVLACRR